ncbi:hypothetical protein AB0I98_27805 [Streptomyces sp. NPDC050211]|uniref:hypothetical protein n=1 Tax=Streptomyces sp. NPDC050211 TaxID=3154932 RepID=UPI003448EFEB
MLPNFRTRLLLIVIAVLFSLVVAFATAFLFYAMQEDFVVALTAAGGSFVATMTLSVGVLALLFR